MIGRRSEELAEWLLKQIADTFNEAPAYGVDGVAPEVANLNESHRRIVLEIGANAYRNSIEERRLGWQVLCYLAIAYRHRHGYREDEWRW